MRPLGEKNCLFKEIDFLLHVVTPPSGHPLSTCAPRNRRFFCSRRFTFSHGCPSSIAPFVVAPLQVTLEGEKLFVEGDWPFQLRIITFLISPLLQVS